MAWEQEVGTARSRAGRQEVPGRSRVRRGNLGAKCLPQLRQHSRGECLVPQRFGQKAKKQENEGRKVSLMVIFRAIKLSLGEHVTRRSVR